MRCACVCVFICGVSGSCVFMCCVCVSVSLSMCCVSGCCVSVCLCVPVLCLGVGSVSTHGDCMSRHCIFMCLRVAALCVWVWCCVSMQGDSVSGHCVFVCRIQVWCCASGAVLWSVACVHQAWMCLSLRSCVCHVLCVPVGGWVLCIVFSPVRVCVKRLGHTCVPCCPVPLYTLPACTPVHTCPLIR